MSEIHVLKMIFALGRSPFKIIFNCCSDFPQGSIASLWECMSVGSAWRNVTSLCIRTAPKFSFFFYLKGFVKASIWNTSFSAEKIWRKEKVPLKSGLFWSLHSQMFLFHILIVGIMNILIENILVGLWGKVFLLIMRSYLEVTLEMIEKMREERTAKSEGDRN